MLPLHTCKAAIKQESNIPERPVNAEEDWEDSLAETAEETVKSAGKTPKPGAASMSASSPEGWGPVESAGEASGGSGGEGRRGTGRAEKVPWLAGVPTSKRPDRQVFEPRYPAFQRLPCKTWRGFSCCQMVAQ